MVLRSKKDLLLDLSKLSVILQLCNSKGYIGQGLTAKIHDLYPEAYAEYKNYCSWFKNGSESEILGTFCGKFVKPNLIVCDAIALKHTGKTLQTTDFDAWKKILQNIERLTRYVNKKFGWCWEIHALDSIGKIGIKDDTDKMLRLILHYFKNSPVRFILHEY